ncbi:hypothetical protein [Stratiformator vulcanicus]|uniref:Uncharacterized protein n=1 Tax=Stratiformator vulcanicus TaxID=2527980 RepID=A0A517QY91_9PLAN|nr:hypothetical protein [Stratiformator vulcanicus]QDT36607.1 hypothetical protein Pan189_09670 [Stratiformator vulcanicus]
MSRPEEQPSPPETEQPEHSSRVLAEHARQRRNAGESDSSEEVSPPQRRTVIDFVLDPRTIQWLMGVGASLLVFGLVLWLWSSGIFDNPAVAATALGFGNLVVLIAGIGLVRKTRYETAGRGLALLASAVMPLNLWFYDSQNLIAIEAGGQLWIPATIICLIYAVTARLIRDPNFAYAMVGGIAMTGLLVLADPRIGKFYDLIAPPALLTVVGLISLHAGRFFPREDPSADGHTFGRAFANAGLIAIVFGELILLTCHIGHVAYSAESGRLITFDWPTFGHAPRLNLAALLIAVSGIYALVYRNAAVVRDRFTPLLVSANVLWATAILADMFAVPTSAEFFIILSSLIGLALAVAGRLGLSSNKVFGDVSLTGNILMLVTGIASAVFTVDQLIGDEASLATLKFLLPMAGVLGLGCLCPTNVAWRQSLIAAAASQVGLSLIILHNFSELNLYQRLEVLSILIGVGHLLFGHVGWSREREDERDVKVTYAFTVGSLLTIVPLLIGMIHARLRPDEVGTAWRVAHEIAPLVFGLLLLAAGLMTRVRVTTLAGGVALATYVLSLVFHIQLPEQLQTTAVYLMIGGGAFFTAAVVMSIYRDRLVSVTERARNHEGVFKVLSWR